MRELRIKNNSGHYHLLSLPDETMANAGQTCTHACEHRPSEQSMHGTTPTRPTLRRISMSPPLHFACFLFSSSFETPWCCRSALFQSLLHQNSPTLTTTLLERLTLRRLGVGQRHPRPRRDHRLANLVPTRPVGALADRR